MLEPTSDTPSTPSHYNSGDPYPLPTKQTQMEFTQIISPKQDPSDLPYPLPLVPTSTPCFVPINIPSNGPSTIPSTGSPNIILSFVPYVLPNHSPSLTYLLPPFINDTVFLPPNYHQFHLQNNYMNTQVLTPSHPQY